MKTFTKDEMKAYVEEKLKTEPIIEAKKIGCTHIIQGKLIKRVQIKNGETYYTDIEGNRIPNEIAEKNFFDKDGNELKGEATIETYTDENGNEVTRTVTILGEKLFHGLFLKAENQL